MFGELFARGSAASLWRPTDGERLTEDYANELAFVF